MASPNSVEVNNNRTFAFRQIITAGWANKSDGNVESPIGHFALVTIDENELPELMDAVFEDCTDVPVKPGNYVVSEDNYGNTQVMSFSTKTAASMAFDLLAAEYASWDGQGASDL